MGAEVAQPRDIEERTYQFALRVVKLCMRLNESPGVKRTLSNQLLRSGTSVGANVEEARAAYSRAEFVCKMAIALKEARETRYWLRLLIDANLIPAEKLTPMLDEATEIMNVIGAITANARRNAP
ncbi:MAG: four helix bundle protein [Fimbriiglobus sp.]